MTWRVGRTVLLLMTAILPLAQSSAGGKTEPAPPKARFVLPPVVLVPGIWDTSSVFDRMAAQLEKAGLRPLAITLKPNDGSVPLEQSASELGRFINARLGSTQPLNIVGFSMGGLVARYYAQRLGGIARIAHLVTISSPHHGTGTALLESAPGVLEMRPGSPFLRDLDQDADRLAEVSCTWIWSPLDIVITPAESSRMPFGRDVQIPVLLHPLMPGDERVIEAVISALES